MAVSDPRRPLAYYDRLAARFRDAGLPLDLTIVQAEVSVLVTNALADDKQAQAAIYVGLIERLRAAGADVAVITSLGGHFCYPVLAPISPLPLVTAMAPLDDYFAANGVGTVGLLGTRAVMESRVYGSMTRTASVLPEGDLTEIGQDYIDMAVAGHCTEDRRQRFFARGRQMVEDQGADAILLGGTDLGLAFHGHDTGYRVIDAVDVHVDALYRLATGDQTAHSYLSRPIR